MDMPDIQVAGQSSLMTAQRGLSQFDTKVLGGLARCT